MPTAPITTPPPITLIGAGGHALVVAEAAAMGGFTLAGAFDDNPQATAIARLNLKHLGLLNAFNPASPPAAAILTLGDLAHRRRILDLLGSALTPSAARIPHPSATIHPSARIDRGVYIGPRAVVHSFAIIGPHAIINTGAIIEHECDIGENTHIAPGAILGGRVRIGPNTLVGLGARILPNLTIGQNCTIAAGAVVTRNIPDNTTALGIPAKPR